MNHLEKRLKQKRVSDKKEEDRGKHVKAKKKYKVIVLGPEVEDKKQRRTARAFIVLADSKEEALKEHKGSIKASEVSDKYMLPGTKPVSEKKAKK